MEDLPMFYIPQPTKMQQAKDIISQSWTWINDNQDNINTWIGIIKSLFSKNQGGTPNTPIPPINQ